MLGKIFALVWLAILVSGGYKLLTLLVGAYQEAQKKDIELDKARAEIDLIEAKALNERARPLFESRNSE